MFETEIIPILYEFFTIFPVVFVESCKDQLSYLRLVGCGLNAQQAYIKECKNGLHCLALLQPTASWEMIGHFTSFVTVTITGTRTLIGFDKSVNISKKCFFGPN